MTLRTVDVDEQMRVLRDGTPVDGLFAVGDITGRGAFTHVSVFQATVLTAHLLGRPEYNDGYHGLAWVTFSDPEVGRVGLSEAQARAAGLVVRVASVAMSASTRGWIHGPGNDGVIKLVADTDAGVLVGATVVGPGRRRDARTADPGRARPGPADDAGEHALRLPDPAPRHPRRRPAAARPTD